MSGASFFGIMLPLRGVTSLDGRNYLAGAAAARLAGGGSFCARLLDGA